MNKLTSINKYDSGKATTLKGGDSVVFSNNLIMASNGVFVGFSSKGFYVTECDSGMIHKVMYCKAIEIEEMTIEQVEKKMGYRVRITETVKEITEEIKQGSAIDFNLFCPECGFDLFNTDNSIFLASNPPQRNVHCGRCSYTGYAKA